MSRNKKNHAGLKAFLIILILLLVVMLKKEPKEESRQPVGQSSVLDDTTSSLIESESIAEPEPLPEPEPEKTELHFSLPDPSVLEGTSAARVDFSHGPSSNNEVHFLVKQQQEDLFSKYNAYAVDLETSAEEKVLYMTFDCGYEYEGRTEACLDILKEKQVPAAFYLVGDFAEMEPELTQRMIDEGHVVGNHTMNHEDLTAIDDAAVMKAV